MSDVSVARSAGERAEVILGRHESTHGAEVLRYATKAVHMRSFWRCQKCGSTSKSPGWCCARASTKVDEYIDHRLVLVLVDGESTPRWIDASRVR